MMLIDIRNCPSCSNELTGEQIGLNEDMHKFECSICDEEWYENIRYCLPEELTVD